MSIHFEELWEKCEKLFSDNLDKDSSIVIIDELLMKLNLYKIINENKDLSKEDMILVKSRTFGEILLTLTNLSLRDSINVFDALATAFKYHAIKHYNEKYNA